MIQNIREKTISGLFWRFAEKCGGELIQFIVSIIIARVLTPDDYGLVGLVTVLIAVANVFATSGLGQALVQRKEISDTDYSTVFYYSITFSVLLYFILFFTAPFIAEFYSAPELVSIIRVLSLMVIVGSVNSVQQAYVQKKMQFRHFFVSTLSGKMVSAVFGIVMAYSGCGVWSLVGQQLSMLIVNTVVLWFSVQWHPRAVFSVKHMKEMFSYGWKILCSNLIDVLYNNIHSLLIGKFYSSADLGYYNRGKQFPMLIIGNINTTIDNVLFPVLSEMQDQKERLKMLVRKSIRVSTFLIFPAMTGLAAIAEPLTIFLLTKKWLPVVPYVRFCCFIYAFWPVHTANLQAIKAIGRSDVFLKMEIIKKVVGIVILAATLPYGLTPMMVGNCAVAVISCFVNAFPNRKLLDYSYAEQFADILPAFIISCCMAVVVLPIALLPVSPFLQMLIQAIVGVVFYFMMAKMLKLESLEYLIVIIKEFIAKRTNTIETK